MNKLEKMQYEETMALRKDMDEMFVRWADRDANGMIICTVMIIQFVAMAGHMFDSPEDYVRFVDETVARGRKRFDVENNGGHYVH